MQTLKPFFSYYGGKWRLAKRYPPPQFDTIIEPFAGSAGYSIRHASRNVVLVDKYPVVAGIWQYLLGASPEEILALPDLGEGETTDDLDIPLGAKHLMGFWLNGGAAYPGKSPSAWMKQGHRAEGYWGASARNRIASQLQYIKHWEASCGDYREIPNRKATWFVDPPYVKGGQYYKHGRINYQELAEWCRSRKGQVIVCENGVADWLPFRPFTQQLCTSRAGRPVRRATELIWTKAPRRWVDLS